MSEPERPPSPHYTQGDIECIDALYSSLGPIGFTIYCCGTAIAYLWRCRDKGNMRRDLEKARDYINFALEKLDD